MFCSGCFEVVSELRVHVIPFFNADVGGYVTTYRCERCWLPSLDETRARLAKATDEAEIASAAIFFERHEVFLFEFRRGDRAPVLRGLVLQMLDRLRSGESRLPIGSTRPL
jgi:hypothetical protein